MRLASAIICARCGLERSGVDFQTARRHAAIPPLAICTPCLGEAVSVIGGTVSQAEHDELVRELNRRTHAAKQNAADLRDAQDELARLRPEHQQMADAVTNLRAHAAAQDTIIATQQADIRAYERGEVPSGQLEARAAAELEAVNGVTVASAGLTAMREPN